MLSLVFCCVLMFALEVKGQDKKIERLERILTIRSPGRISITQSDLLELESLELAEPQMSGKILEIDFEVKKRNALQLLKNRLTLDSCDDGDVVPFSFLLGKSRKQRYFGAVCTSRIIVVDYVRNLFWLPPTPSSFFISFNDHVCKKNRDRCKFKPATFTYATIGSDFVCTIVVTDPQDPSGKEWISHWVFQDDPAKDFWPPPKPLSLSPVYLIDSRDRKEACPSARYISFFNASDVFHVLRYCPATAFEGARGSSLELWSLNRQRGGLQLAANFTSLSVKQGPVGVVLLSIAMVNNYFVLFHANYTFYLSSRELTQDPEADLEVSSFGPDSNQDTYCNRMELEVIGCTSLISFVLNGTTRHFLKFTEFSQFEGGLMQFNPVVVPISAEDRKGLRLENSINLNHFILIQTGTSRLMLLSRKNVSNVKIFDFAEFGVHRLSCFQFEDQLVNKLDGYVIAATFNRTSERNPKVLRLLKVTLPYFEVVSHKLLQNESCNSYLRNCLSFDLSFETNTATVVRQVYLIGSSFTSVIKIKEENTIDRLFNMNEFNFNMTEYFYGFLTDSKARVVHQLDRNASAYIGINNDGPVVGKQIFPAVMSLQVSYLILNFDSVLWSNIVVHEDETISVFLLVTSSSQRFAQRPLQLMHFFPSFPIEEESITLPSSYCTIKFMSLPFAEQRPKYLLLDFTQNNSTENVEFLEYSQRNRMIDGAPFRSLEFKRISWYRNESRALSPKESYFRVKLEPTEETKTVRAFSDGETSYLLVLTNTSIIISRFEWRPLLELNRLNSISFADLTRDKITVLDSVDCSIHRDLLFIDLKVSVPDEDRQKKDSTHTRVYVMKILPGKTSMQFLGFIQHKNQTLENYHVFVMTESRKLIFVDLNDALLMEYNLDDGLNWIDRMDGNFLYKDIVSVGPILPDSTLDLTEFGNPRRNLIQLSKLVQGINDTRTLTIRKDSNLFALNATFIQWKPKQGSKQPASETVRYNLVFATGLNDPLTILHMRLVDSGSFIETIVTGNPNPDRFPLISIDFIRDSISRLHLNFYETGKFMKVNYQKLYFRDGLYSSALNFNFKDISDNAFLEQFIITKDYRSNIIAPIEAYSNSSTLQINFEDLGLISSVHYGCLDYLDTELKWKRELVGFRCPASKFSIDYHQPLLKEGSLRLDGSRPKRVKELFPLDYSLLNRSNYFIILYDDELAIAQSSNDRLVYKAIVRENKQVKRSETPVKLADCFKINILWVVERYGKEVAFDMTLFCKLNGQNSEVQVYFICPMKQLGDPDKPVAELRLFSRQSIPVDLKVWNGVVVMDEYRLTANQILTVITEVVIQSVGKKRIIESYYRDIKNKSSEPYISIYSTLYDKYDSYDILSFHTLKYNCTAPASAEDICIKYILLKHCPEQSKIKIFKEKRRFNINSPNKDQPDAESKSSQVNLNPDKHGTVKDGHIIYNVDEGAESIFYYLICDDYIYEYRWNHNFTQDPYHQLIARYNYLGLCSDSSYFKLDFAFGYLKVNCIPQDSDPYPNNILLFKRPDVIQSGVNKSNWGSPLNASHILTQTAGYNYLNSFHYLIKSEDSKIRLIKTSPTNLADQYLVNPFAKLHVNRNKYNPFSEPEINIHLSNYYTEQNFTLKFSFNETNALRNTVGFLEDTQELLIVIVVYLCLLLVMLLIEKSHRIFNFSNRLTNALVHKWRMRTIRKRLRKYNMGYIEGESELLRNHFELENQSRQVTTQLLTDATF